MKPTLSIKQNEEGQYFLIIQKKDKDGKFGTKEELPLEEHEAKTLSLDDLYQLYLQDMETNQSPLLQEETKTPIEAKKESLVSRVVNTLKSFRFRLFIFVVFAIVFGVPSFGQNRASEIERQVNSVTSTITEVRKERETVYSSCVNVCDAGRSEYDAIVTKLKAEKAQLELELQREKNKRAK